MCDGDGSCVMKGAQRRAGTCDVCRRRGEQHVEAKMRRESWAASWATSGWAASDLLTRGPALPPHLCFHVLFSSLRLSSLVPACCLLHFCPARAAHPHNKRYQARTANVQMPMPMNIIIITDTSILYKVISHDCTTK